MIQLHNRVLSIFRRMVTVLEAEEKVYDVRECGIKTSDFVQCMKLSNSI